MRRVSPKILNRWLLISLAKRTSSFTKSLWNSFLVLILLIVNPKSFCGELPFPYATWLTPPPQIQLYQEGKDDQKGLG
ncbi:MAG: hypothetical protein ACK4OO_04435, partial [bacterium]